MFLCVFIFLHPNGMKIVIYDIFIATTVEYVHRYIFELKPSHFLTTVAKLLKGSSKGLKVRKNLIWTFRFYFLLPERGKHAEMFTPLLITLEGLI